MASPVGVGVGDCINGLKVACKAADVILDANKAPDEVRLAERTSDVITGSLEHVEAAFTPCQSNSRVREIIEHAQDFAAREKEHSHKRDKRYGKKLGGNVTRRKMHAVPEKIRWTFHGKKDDERHRNDQQGSLDALNTNMVAYIVDKQHENLATTERVLTQGEAHFHSAMKSTTDTGTTILQKMEETGLSVQQQQRVLERAIETKFTKLDDRLTLIQQQFGGQSSSEDLQKLLQRIETLIGMGQKINELGLTQGRSMSAEETLADQRLDLGCRKTTTSQPYRAKSSSRGLELTKRISVLTVGDRSVELAWQSTSGSTATSIPAISTNEGGVYLTLLLVILAACCEIVLEMGRYISSQGSKWPRIPAPVSFLLSDNIYFTDALGREFRLCLDQTSTWDMLNGWLREQFKGCPGSSKVQSGQFFIFDPQDPDRIISRTTWSKAVGPRRRFQMGIVFSHTQLSEHCLRCRRQEQKKPLTRGRGEFNVLCPTCGTVYSSSALRSQRPRRRFSTNSSRLLARAATWSLPYRNVFLEYPPLGMEYLTEEYAWLVKEPASDALDLDSHLDLEIANLPARPSWEDERDLSMIAYSHWKEEEFSEDPVEEPAVYVPLSDMLQESDDEQRDFEYFKVIWINSDTRLHDAALRGDCSLARELISQGHDPNQRTGSTGSPLIVAILKGGYDIVELLLNHGADPLLPVQQGHTPVSVAACHATNGVGHLVFPAAFRASYQRPADFQMAVDRALYESTTKEHEWLDFLLFIGANPAAPCPGPRQSAFAKALKAKDVALLKSFLMVLWERGILNPFETIILDATIKGENVPLAANPKPWLRVCCAALAAGDPQPAVREINKRIRKKPDPYFRLNIGNCRCGHDVQRFWRNRENERNGIVVPPEFADII